MSKEHFESNQSALLSGATQDFKRRQHGAEIERGATTAAERVASRLYFSGGQIGSEAVAQFDQRANALERDLAIGVHEAVVADFHKTCGQDMLEEAADELHGIESKSSRSLAVRLAIANEHGAVVEVQDAGIGDSDLEDIGGEIFESSLTGARGLAVNVPICLPDVGRDLLQQFGLFDQIAELSSEDFRECFDGEKEIDSGRMPRAIGRTESAARNDVVDMRMILKGSAPGVQYAEEARQIAADVLGIGGEFF